MQITELRLKNFGKFNNKSIHLEEGINLIYGFNEAGKSTIHGFLQGMLFGIEKQRGRATKEDTYIKYQPWEHPTTYEGSLDLVYQGKSYRIFRSFYKENKEYKVIELTTGREVPVLPIKGVSFIDHLTEDNYRNTISIEQLKARTDKELADEVRNHIANLSLSKSNQVNVTEAINHLIAKRKQIEANQTKQQVIELEEDIKKNLLEDAKMERISLDMKQLEEQLKQEEESYQIEDLDRVDNYIAEYPRIKEKYEQYHRLLTQRENLQDMLKEVVEKENQGVHQEVILKENLEKKPSSDPVTKKPLYFILITLCLIIGVLLLNGIHMKSFLLIGLGIILIWGVYYAERRHTRGRGVPPTSQSKEKDLLSSTDTIDLLPSTVSSKNTIDVLSSTNTRDLLSPANTVVKEPSNNYKNEEKIRLIRSIEEVDVLKKEEEQIILGYGSRICAITQLDDTSMAELETEIHSIKENLNQKREVSTKLREGIRSELERLRWELEVLEEKESYLFEKRTAYKEKIEKLEEEKKEISAITLAIDTLNRISSNIHDDYGQNLNKMMSRIIKEQTGGKYSEIKVDEKLNIKVVYKDQFIDIGKLSVGTIEQIYLALRLSVTRLLFGEEKMPLLFDDTFVYYDINRLRATLEVLASEEDRQILIFTCHNREEELLKELNISYRKILLTD